MKLYHKRKLSTALVASGLAIACFTAYIKTNLDLRFLIALLLSLVYAGISYYSAFSKDGAAPPMAEDERDVFITLKTSWTTLWILSKLLFAGCVVTMGLYVALRSPICMAVLITLCVVSIVLFICLLCANLYYEKHS